MSEKDDAPVSAAQEACPKCGRGLPHLAPCEWYLECDRKKPPAPAGKGTLSCHDHGNCELCDQIDAEVAALRERASRLERDGSEFARAADEWKTRADAAEADRERLREALRWAAMCPECASEECDPDDHADLCKDCIDTMAKARAALGEEKK